MGDSSWEFTFVVVEHGATKEEALEAAREYIAEMAQRGTLEPVKAERIGE